MEVTKAGQLQYTLNIEVPPGIKDVSPNVSLIYTSGGQNGLAGYNWNVAGLSSISRTGKTLENDGITKRIQLDYSDYYSFNGQRLILKSGEYGQDGAEYVTENYSNTKIKSFGTLSGWPWKGPEYWEVSYPDGSRAWYGGIATGYSTSRSPVDYNIVKFQDRNGNYITYNYLLGGNVSVISSIEWGGNSIQGTAHYNKINFIFQERPTPETAYIKGESLVQSKLLESIVVSSNDSQYKKYKVTYKKDLQETDYRYLDKITVSNSTDEESNPVTFTYEKSLDRPNPNVASWGYPSVVNHNYLTDLFGDFDGDGRIDLIKYQAAASPVYPTINQPGLYLFKNFYSWGGPYHEPVLLGNSISATELKNSIAINLKRDNFVNNRQGFVTYNLIANPSTSKKDLKLSFYKISNDNNLILDFTKTIPNIDTYNDDPDSIDPIGSSTVTILGIKNFDFNGDGLSELIVQLNYRFCSGGGIDPNTPIFDDGGNLLPGQTCQNFQRFIVVDPDESIQNDAWHYSMQLYNYQEDPFKTYKSGDFNGDGLIDFIKLDQNKKSYLITFQKNFQGKYESNLSSFDSIIAIKGMWKDGLTGDFNGDGLTDIMVPYADDTTLWYLYTSKGIGFSEDPKHFNSQYRNRTVFKDPYDNISIGNPRTFVAFDINNDGKTELISLQSGRSYQKEYNQDNPSAGTKYRFTSGSGVKVFSTFGGNPDYTPSGDNHSWGLVNYLNSSNIDNALAVGYFDRMAIPVDHLAGAMLKNIALISQKVDSDGRIGMHIHSYYDISMEGRIKSITQGGITTEISYKQLDKVKNPGLYDGDQPVNYPNVEINQSAGMYVVSSLTQTITSNKKLKQDYKYRGLTSNILGTGMIGFRKQARSSWYTEGFENTKIWSGVEIDPINKGVPIKEWSIRTNVDSQVFPVDLSENNTQLLSLKTTTYQIDKILNGQVVTTVGDDDKSKVVTAIIPKTSRTKDFLTNVIAENTTTYGDYYMPSQSISRINNSYSVNTTDYQYSHNSAGDGPDYFIGRLVSKIDVVNAYGDTKSDKEEYTYENNNLKTTKNWNWDNTAYTLNTFVYDGFGQVIQKVLSNSLDSQTITSSTEYDSTGRFIVKETDNSGFHTQITYDNWGQILTKTDHFGNNITNTYDGWGKLISSSNNLGGISTYIYTKDENFNVTLTKNDPDGNVSKSFTNKFGQLYRTTTKSFAQGQFVSKDIKYDLLGRKTQESEPYFDDQNATIWNLISYDDSVYPATVTATSLAKISSSGTITSIGKQVVTTISGLTTTTTEVNNYNKTSTKTTDALGNLISTTDKGGMIQFFYNAGGQQIKASYGNNSVETKYDAWGRKSEFVDPSNGEYKYEYDAFGRSKKTISPKGEKVFNYNNLGQLTSQVEFSTIDGGQTTNKTTSYAYNNKGLITLKSGTVEGQGFSIAYTYDTYGRLLSSVENSNGKIYSQKGLTYNNSGKITSYEKELISFGNTTKVSVDNLYSGWNGELYQIKDKNTGKILWELNDVNAKGQVIKSKLGAVDIVDSYDDNGYLSSINHSSLAKPNMLQILYSFDAIKNELKRRTTGGDFNILETFDYDDNNRLVNWTNPVTNVKPSSNRNVYDVKGRITENDQIGHMKFENTSKIYQATGMTLNTQGIQNYSGDLIQTVTYNENNDPVMISGEKFRVKFDYGLGSTRQRVSIIKLMNPTGGGGEGDPPISEFSVAESSDLNTPVWQTKITKIYNEDNSFEVIRNQTSGLERHIMYIEGTPYESNIVYLKEFGQDTASYKFLHKDYLGSILAISDEDGNKVEQRHFDAWGNFTHLQLGSGSINTNKNSIAELTLLIDRGYTSHEHFLNVGIIHMNGRLYDPLLRRFLNADENIQDATNTQNYNKYGYVLNNPMMYNDPNGEFWWWLAGAAAGGYLNGVQANGSWNPGKWNWEKTWSAVLGGAIGGASIGGALGNIANNAGAIKNFLPGIVSGGLSSAFSGSNFLGGAISGITYSTNIFDNSVTSTDGSSNSYRYIVSPESFQFGGGWEDLTKKILLNYVRTNFCQTCSYGQLQQKAGKMFEDAFNAIMTLDNAQFNYTSNSAKIAGMYKNRPRNTIPDGVLDLVHYEIQYRKDNVKVGPFNIRIPVPTGRSEQRFRGVQFAEVKAMDGTLYSGSNQGQISAMLWSMYNNRGVRSFGGRFIIGTTSDTIISPGIYTLGTSYGITVSQMTSQYRMVSGQMEVRFSAGWPFVTINSAYIR
ncbi:RHS repeat-associated core domain-containing protein [Chryseobacterium arachidis]|uniref:RHS repeat-associated core domain-containing protein n=1 Tax=Chryseobacterium arachidis TaxID=1416778 RepID=UPI003618263B